MKSLIITLAALLLTMGMVSARAQQPDMDLMMKWSSVAVIHYDVVAEYAGETEILRGPRGFTHFLQVKDRVNVVFDWNQNETKLAGTPIIKNSPTTVSPGTPKTGCPPVRVDGAYEFADVTAAKGVENSPVLELTAKRTFPAGAIPYPGQHATGTCGDAWDESAARSEIVTLGIIVVPAMYFAMPRVAPAGTTVGKDGKTITSVQNGWTYTYTMSTKP